jgi:hypothetical protein
VHERTRAEERRSERTELTSRAYIGDTGDREAVNTLERPNRGERSRSDDCVDRAQIETLRPKRNLEPCVLRVRRTGGRGCHQPCRERARTYQPKAHRWPNTAQMRAFLPERFRFYEIRCKVPTFEREPVRT